MWDFSFHSGTAELCRWVSGQTVQDCLLVADYGITTHPNASKHSPNETMNIRENLNHQNVLIFFHFRNSLCLGKQSKEKEIWGETKALLCHEQTSGSAGRRLVNVIYIQTKSRS